MPLDNGGCKLEPDSTETNDARFWRGGLVRTGNFYDYLQDTLASARISLPAFMAMIP